MWILGRVNVLCEFMISQWQICTWQVKMMRVGNKCDHIIDRQFWTFIFTYIHRTDYHTHSSCLVMDHEVRNSSRCRCAPLKGVRAGSHYSTLKWCALLLSPLPTIVPLTRILVFWLIVPQGLLLVVKVNKIKVVTSCHFLDSTRVSRLQLSDWSICFQRCWPVKANRKEFYFITAALNSAETRGNGDCNWWPPWERLNTIELVNSVRRA